MSIIRVNPGGYGFAGNVTSSAFNAIDANIENALDKRVGYSDTLASTITLTGSILGGTLTSPTITSFTSNGGTISGALSLVSGSSLVYSPARTKSVQVSLVEAIVDSNTWTRHVSTLSVASYYRSTGNTPVVGMELGLPVLDGSLTSVDVFYSIGSPLFPATFKPFVTCRIHDVVGLSTSTTSVAENYFPGTDATSYYGLGVMQVYTLPVGYAIQRSRHKVELVITPELPASDNVYIWGVRVNYSVTQFA